jgi:hypothetical protein
MSALIARPDAARALSTACSNPQRERILSAAQIMLPRDNIRSLERRFDMLAPRIGMSTWGTALASSSGHVESRTLGLQSPEVSVSIEAHWRPGQKFVTVEVRRTCINDALEPWRHYWWGFVTELENAGYAVKPVSKQKVR